MRYVEKRMSADKSYSTKYNILKGNISYNFHLQNPTIQNGSSSITQIKMYKS